jgi:Putative Ice-binding-like adhesive domain/PEP-CTERM motif
MFPGPVRTRRNVWLKMSRMAWLLTPLAIFLNASLASATGFDLGAFETYGILVNDGAANGDINTAPVNSNIGIGAITGTVNLHNEVVNGKVDCEGNCSSVVSNGAITGTQPVSLGGASPNGSPAALHSNVAAVESAITTAKSLSSTFGAESGASVTINGTTQTINATSGTLDANGVRVFTSTSFSIGNGHTLTINGAATDFVVINITGNGNALNGAMTLTGGITADHVLINFLGTGELGGAANGATLQGTFLVPNEKVNLNSLTIAGHLFGGVAGQDFQLVSNSFVAQPPIPTAVPEPTTLLLAGTALAILGMWSRKRLLGKTTV